EASWESDRRFRMDSILLTSTKKLVPNDLARRLSQIWRVEATADDGLVVRGPSSRVYLVFEAAPNEKGLFRIFLNYSSVDLVKEVLKQMADDLTITVNNDFGTVLPGNKFVERIRSEPNWNWRGRGG
ncbi:MAG TPA: hypothetical protein VGP94_16450, partial [Tepidisphaeraceae bacterium]|nr:hypothetical protein [Tepidisphaeraceae bacterium]